MEYRRFFFLHLLFGGVGLARKTGELGGSSFIQMVPTEIRTYSLSSNLIPSSTRITHTLQKVPEVVNWSAKDFFPKWPFCFNVGRKAAKTEGRGSALKRALPTPRALECRVTQQVGGVAQFPLAPVHSRPPTTTCSLL